MPGEVDGRPLLDNRVDAGLFVDREALLTRAARSVRGGVNALITGPRGSGKTSTLNRLAVELRNGGPEPVLVDGRVAEGVTGVLRGLRRRLGGT
ncbi:MAG: ATP-binding protein, partial [Candidatus Dormibacteraeota bacterium]|nr:ATP-binding protein [Candidatus Dormibacteraeota bacterium]